jgi:hypothetical protein
MISKLDPPPRMRTKALRNPASQPEAIDPVVPAAIATPLHREYFDRWFDLLLQHGSPSLKKRHRRVPVDLLNFLAPPATGLEFPVEVAFWMLR